MAPMLELNVEFKFPAAHRLPCYAGPCYRTHGHNYRFCVTIRGTPDAHSGMVMDFTLVEQVVREKIVDKVDHQNLNDFLENPTAENIVVWFWELLEKDLPGLAKIQLWEMDGLSVTYRGERDGGS